ncbi:hypothetical protein IG631_16608 [Alternaria alternata]|nr:hypothetical protein IG631_16608 [Alternaria alternata]
MVVTILDQGEHSEHASGHRAIMFSYHVLDERDIPRRGQRSLQRCDTRANSWSMGSGSALVYQSSPIRWNGGDYVMLSISPDMAQSKDSSEESTMC